MLLDVRTSEEYAEGYIEGRRNIPLQSIEQIGRIIENKHIPLFVHCRSGGRSAQAADILNKMGYTNVNDIGSLIEDGRLP